MSMCLVVLLLSLITVGEGVEVGVVEQGVVTITPGEGLSTDPHVIVLLEFWSHGVLGHTESIDVAKDDDGNGGEEEGLLPVLVAVSSVTRHVSHGGSHRSILGQNSGAVSDEGSHS